MFEHSAAWYDALYSFKDYRREAEILRAGIQQRLPQAQTLLDVACGTAAHHPALLESFQVDGLDLNPVLLELAAPKNPEGHFFQADMTRFELKQRYDVITCLFSSIGYLDSVHALEQACSHFAQHLKRPGLLAIEPWFTPETWKPGKVHMLTHEGPDLKICRMNRSETLNHQSVLHFHYLVGTELEGVRSFEEIHTLSLFSRQEFQTALEKAGFQVDYDPEGLTGRGLYWGFLA